jgi:hypothetical protein
MLWVQAAGQGISDAVPVPIFDQSCIADPIPVRYRQQVLVRLDPNPTFQRILDPIRLDFQNIYFIFA